MLGRSRATLWRAAVRTRAQIGVLRHQSPRIGHITPKSPSTAIPAPRFMTTSVSVESLPSAFKSRLVGLWLGATAGSVVVMILLGGATRLTRSGLSMVDWSPQGRPLPKTTEEWEKEFDNYKQFPEYKLVNKGMSLEEFKFIYWMEWFHRMWGRGMGVGFLVPGTALAATGSIASPLVAPIIAAFSLGGLQGLVGWWMVKSGLQERPKTGPLSYRPPRVSPYRLTAHLVTALSIYSVLTWSSLSAFQLANLKQAHANANTNNPTAPSATPQNPAQKIATPKPATTLFSNAAKNAAKSLRVPSHAVLALAGLTIVSGGFVAGNDAGRAFNDWPLFAGRVVPEGMVQEGLGWRNATENTAMVQFNHRHLAYGTLAASAWAFLRARSLSNLPRALSHRATAVAIAAATQASIGISTLMLYVPTSLGVAHQAGAILLWTAALALRHEIKHVLSA